MEDKFTPWESVVSYVWSLNLREQSPPFLAGRRDPLINIEMPTTQSLSDLSWFPKLHVAGQSPKNLGELVCLYKWKKVQARIQWILEYWLKHPLPLKVLNEVVTPYQMLEEQSRGWRVITLPVHHKDLSTDVVPGKKPLAFVLHDLEHAERFFHDEQNYLGQVGFYHLLQESVADGFWSEHLKNSQFEKGFFYLMSDMNTHCVHMTKYLRAILWDCFGAESEKIWSDLNLKWGLSKQLVEIENDFIKHGRALRPKGLLQ